MNSNPAEARPYNSAHDWSGFLRQLVLKEVVEAGVAPAGALAVVRVRDGKTSVNTASVGVPPEALFDLASLTKPVTALCSATLVRKGKLRWDEPLSSLLPLVSGTPGGERSLDAHLSHRAGLLAHLELFRDAMAGAAVRRELWLLEAARATRADGSRDALYSDLGYLLVGAGLEERLGLPLDEVVREHVTGPLGLELGAARAFPRSGKREFVKTEWQPERGGDLVGVVHDDNAWYFSGSGLSGHAGLFGTIGGVAKLCGFLLEDEQRNDGAFGGAVREMRKRRDASSLRLGFDGVSPGSSAGALASPETFGHLGFTGTSFWCDPERGAAIVLLTNRVRPSRLNLRIRAARPRVHDAIWSALDAGL